MLVLETPPLTFAVSFPQDCCFGGFLRHFWMDEMLVWDTSPVTLEEGA